jgi:hypothetical protein
MIMNEQKARAIAFYLPQYHPVKVNDEFWGKGFTEWTNVTKAKPLYKGHKQPKLPSDLGFYDLRVPQVRAQQAQLAKDAGIEAFCYWHYWFGNGKRVLERIFDEVLSTGEPDFSFCLGWANESWSGRWHGLDNEILLEQKYPGKEDYLAHFNAILPALKDKRYFKVNNRCIFLVYKPKSLPNEIEFTEYWDSLAEQNGLNKFYFVGVGDNWSPKSSGFEKRIRSNLIQNIKQAKRNFNQIISRKSPKDIFNYSDIINKRMSEEIDDNEIPLIITNWDNTPRSSEKGCVFQKSTPSLYKKWLDDSINKISHVPFQERILFIKSWNEWAEGNCLEPSIEFGHEYLSATKDSLFY